MEMFEFANSQRRIRRVNKRGQAVPKLRGARLAAARALSKVARVPSAVQGTLTMKLGKGRFSSSASYLECQTCSPRCSPPSSKSSCREVQLGFGTEILYLSVRIAGARSPRLDRPNTNHPGRNSTIQRRKKSIWRKETVQFEPIHILGVLHLCHCLSQPPPLDETRYTRSRTLWTRRRTS